MEVWLAIIYFMLDGSLHVGSLKVQTSRPMEVHWPLCHLDELLLDWNSHIFSLKIVP